MSRNKAQNTAQARTRKWMKSNGIVIDRCELCGITKQQLIDRHNNWVASMKAVGAEWGKPAPRMFFVAHHWKGYEFSEDVWLICYSCNRKLEGKHDGSLNKEEAQRYVSDVRLYAGRRRRAASSV